LNFHSKSSCELRMLKIIWFIIWIGLSGCLTFSLMKSLSVFFIFRVDAGNNSGGGEGEDW